LTTDLRNPVIPTKQYACLNCGFVHHGKKMEKLRIDKNHTGGRFMSCASFHGFITNRICPECNAKQQINFEED